MLESEQRSDHIFSGFADSFTADQHPEILYLTGGEPLLRPSLICDIAATAHASGTKVVLITGLYYARPDGRIPPSLLRALLAVDHVTASMDVYHEAEVPRAAAFATMATLVGSGKDVSFQIVGTGSGDPYLKDLTSDIRTYFAGKVPAFVARLSNSGRARQWLARDVRHRDAQPIAAPCSLAAWPVVSFDGSIVACCQQYVVDGPAPPHLRLGTAPQDGWPAIAQAMRDRAVLRVIRTYGPEVLAQEASLELSPRGYCATCALAGSAPAGAAKAEEIVARRAFPVIESVVLRTQVEVGPANFVARYGIPEYSHMITLGLSA